MTFRILNLEPHEYSTKAQRILECVAKLDSGPMTRQNFLKNIEKYDGLIVRLEHLIDEEVFQFGRNLSFVGSATTGLNHIDMDAAKKYGVEVLSLRGETDFLQSIHATAEHSFGLMLSVIRHVPAAHNDVMNGAWHRDQFKGDELAGKTICILGLGRLGSKMASYAHAFGMNVLAYDINAVNCLDYVKMVSLDELISNADVLSVHLPYDKSTHGFLDKNIFSRIKENCILINTSRGEIVVESCLLKALRSRQISGAALDVLCGENSGDKDWMKKCPLIQYAQEHKNLIITPHIGGLTRQSLEKAEMFIADKIKNFLESR